MGGRPGPVGGRAPSRAAWGSYLRGSPRRAPAPERGESRRTWGGVPGGRGEGQGMEGGDVTTPDGGGERMETREGAWRAAGGAEGGGRGCHDP